MLDELRTLELEAMLLEDMLEELLSLEELSALDEELDVFSLLEETFFEELEGGSAAPCGVSGWLGPEMVVSVEQATRSAIAIAMGKRAFMESP
jgi:hypothetical protein